MTTPYQPPVAEVLPAPAQRISFGAIALRLVILVYCSLQFVMLSLNWNAIIEALKAGYSSPAGMAASFVFTFALMLAGLLLLFSRKLAMVFFWSYVPYQLYFLSTPRTPRDIAFLLANLGCIAACLLYCRALNRAGKLK